MFIKHFMLAVALAAASLLTAQQMMIWNASAFGILADPAREFSHLPNTIGPGDQHPQPSYGDREQRFTRLLQKPTDIYVLGERNSGTNYVSKILKKAFLPPNNPDPTRTHEYFSSDIPVLLHKHMFRHHLLNEIELSTITKRTDILWLFAVRSPCDWAEAMKRMPWHMCPPHNITNCPNAKFIGFEKKEVTKTFTLEQFFRLEWGDWPESRNFRNLSFVSKNYIYRNVFHLRRHKLKLMKQIMDAVPRNVKIVRLHELERAPHVFIHNLAQEFNLTTRKQYKKALPSEKMHFERCLTADEWKVANREIDWDIEGQFGYTYLDCHMCY